MKCVKKYSGSERLEPPEFGNVNKFYVIDKKIYPSFAKKAKEGEEWEFVVTREILLKKRDCYGTKQYLLICKPVRRYEEIRFDSKKKLFIKKSGSVVISEIVPQKSSELEIYVGVDIEIVKRHVRYRCEYAEEKEVQWLYSSLEKDVIMTDEIKKLRDIPQIKEVIKEDKKRLEEWIKRCQEKYGKIIVKTTDYWDCPSESEIREAIEYYKENSVPPYLLVRNIDDIYYCWSAGNIDIITSEGDVTVISKESIEELPEGVIHLYNLVRLYRYLMALRGSSMLSNDFIENNMQFLKKALCEKKSNLIIALESLLFRERKKDSEKEKFIDQFCNLIPPIESKRFVIKE